MRLRCLRGTALAVMTLANIGTNASDTVIGGVSGTNFSGSSFNQGTFGGISLGLQHGMEHGGYLVGVSETDFPIGSLSEVDFDAYRVESPRLSVTAGASVGEAAAGSQSDVLYKARFSIDSQIDPMWSLHGGYQYIDLNAIHGNLIAATVEVRPLPLLGFKVGGCDDVGGTVADRYGSMEINWYGKQHLVAGLIIGRTGYDPASLGEVAVVERLFQLYLGASVPMRVGMIAIGVDTLRLEDSARQTLRIGLSEPIKP